MTHVSPHEVIAGLTVTAPTCVFLLPSSHSYEEAVGGRRTKIVFLLSLRSLGGLLVLLVITAQHVRHVHCYK
ncbi:hypothetical protein BS78_05G281700 [Paspalum vaginatum]|nr:hypothetical protein BS78_05G281700 [Paspalum vaginatum]